MSVKSFNESFRRAYQKDTVKRKDNSLYKSIVESVERASKNRGSGQNLSQFEQLIQETIENQTGKNWYEVADNNMAQILFEEYDIRNAAKRLLHISESNESLKNVLYENVIDELKEYGIVKAPYREQVSRKRRHRKLRESDNAQRPIATKGITNGLSMNIYDIDNGIDDEVTYGYSDEDKTYTANIEYKDDGTFFVDKDGTKHNIDDFMRVDEDWASVYKNFEKIVDKYLPDEDKIQSEVEKLYNQHKGEPDWDKAWEKWNITDKVDNVDEALKTNSKKAMDNLKQYIMDNCTPEDYGVSVPSDFAGVATLILDTFREEKYSSKADYRYYHNNERAAFEDWLQGLPSIFDPGYYYQGSAVEDLGNILEETDEEKEKYSEEQAEDLLTQLIYRELKKAERKNESKRCSRRGNRLMEMKVTRDIDLKDFDFWSGARNTVEYLTDDEIDTIQSILEEEYPEGMDETAVNDFFWYEDDTIAEWLGYNNFDEIIDRNSN